MADSGSFGISLALCQAECQSRYQSAIGLSTGGSRGSGDNRGSSDGRDVSDGRGVGDGRPSRQSRESQRFPDIVAVKVRSAGAEVFDFDVTVSSPYDTPALYADGFRVTSLSGEVFGERKLLHDHQDEQPFTRDLHGVRIPRQVRQVVVQGRDQQHGYGGKSVQVQLPGR